jgi:3-hydroxyacyl-[acyl-carrier-protein] dehydratase
VNPPAVEVPLPVARDHPSFDGHFPGRPILPGVALLGEVFAALARNIAFDPVAFTLASAKFLRPVPPGEALVLRFTGTPGGTIRFEVHGEAGPVASGAVAPRREQAAA